MISIELSSSGHLFLTEAEADRLAETIRQKLICRTAAQANDPVMVADILLTTEQAWRLVDKLDALKTVEEIDWAVEGF